MPRALAALVERLLSKDREARFPDAEAVVAALDGHASDGARGQESPGRRLALIGVGVTVLVGLGLFLVQSGGDAAGSSPAASLPAATAPGTTAPGTTAPGTTAPSWAPPTAAAVGPGTAPPSAAPTQVAAAVRLVAVTITSDPAGAQVVEGGRPIGRTPLTVKRPQGSRGLTFVLRRDGFTDGRVTVTPTNDTRGHARLEPMFELVP